MSIKLPKHLRGFAFDRVLTVEMNNFDVDILLPSLFYRVIAEGQDKGTNHNDPTAIDEYVSRLASSEAVVGFDEPYERRLLYRLCRTTLMEIGSKGEGGAGRRDNIQGFPGRTLLEFKPGFPRDGSHARKVDLLLYRMLRERLHGNGELRSLLEETFGKGVRVQGGATPTGEFDGDDSIDILTRLSIAFMDGFVPVSPRPRKERELREPCPKLAENTARDLWRYLEAYRTLMPNEALTYHFKSLINLELFVYSLRLIHAIPSLVADPSDLPPAMSMMPEGSPPQLYVDFTGGTSSSPSRAMATACVRRDIEAIGRFIQSNLLLRLLDTYVRQLRGDRRANHVVASALSDEGGGPEYLQALLRLREEPVVAPRIEAAAQRDEDEIRSLNGETDREDDTGSAANAEIDSIAAPAESDFERAVLLITEAQRSQITTNVVSWYWSVGGLQKSHGILAGTQKSRQSWRYAPSNDLLATLVQLAAVDLKRVKHGNVAPAPFRLRAFLAWLDERFGIIVDHPPEQFQGAEYVAAAQENLRSMLHRLQQMGIFRDLSDDFTVQRLVPPYSELKTGG